MPQPMSQPAPQPPQQSFQPPPQSQGFPQQQPAFQPQGFGPSGPPPQQGFAPQPSGPPSGPPPMGQQQQQQWQQAHMSANNFTPPSKKKIYLAIAGAVAIAVLGVVGTIVKNKVFGKKSRGSISYASLDVDKKHANIDQVIGALESRARRDWRRDASWWSLNVFNVRPDGTVDVTAGGGAAVVKFVSASRVQAATKRGRKDSIKEYNLTANGVRSNKIISATKPWKGFEPLPTPGCKIADLVAELGKKGFTDGTVRISFDPKFGFASGWNWRVFAKGKPYDGYYSMDNCSFSKSAPK
jgi:hypothetical protein